MNDLCPLYTSGATIEFGSVVGGGSLAFTEGASSVSDLRERARRVVEMHNERLEGVDSTANPSAGAATVWRSMPNALASVEDITGGARVVLQPSDPAELDSLREQLQTRSGRMNRDVCPAIAR